MIISVVYEGSEVSGILLPSFPPDTVEIHFDIAVTNEFVTFDTPNLVFHTVEGDVLYEIIGIDVSHNSFIMGLKEDKR